MILEKKLINFPTVSRKSKKESIGKIGKAELTKEMLSKFSYEYMVREYQMRKHTDMMTNRIS